MFFVCIGASDTSSDTLLARRAYLCWRNAWSPIPCWRNALYHGGVIAQVRTVGSLHSKQPAAILLLRLQLAQSCSCAPGSSHRHPVWWGAHYDAIGRVVWFSSRAPLASTASPPSSCVAAGLDRSSWRSRWHEFPQRLAAHTYASHHLY